MNNNLFNTNSLQGVLRPKKGICWMSTTYPFHGIWTNKSSRSAVSKTVSVYCIPLKYTTYTCTCTATLYILFRTSYIKTMTAKWRIHNPENRYDAQNWEKYLAQIYKQYQLYYDYREPCYHKTWNQLLLSKMSQKLTEYNVYYYCAQVSIKRKFHLYNLHLYDTN